MIYNAPQTPKFTKRLDEMSKFLKQFGTPLSEKAYLLTIPLHSHFTIEFGRDLKVLKQAGIIETFPYNTDDQNMYAVFVNGDDLTQQRVVQKAAIRLPRTDYLATLTAADFFLLLRLLANCRITPSLTMTLDLAEEGMSSLADKFINFFFVMEQKNYRLNPTYCSKEWTPIAALKAAAQVFSETKEGQLEALQYLAAKRSTTVNIIPVDTIIENDIEDDWAQLNDDYLIMPSRKSH